MTNKTLTRINLDGLDLSVRDVVALLRAFEANHTLQEIKMTVNMEPGLDRDKNADQAIRRYQLGSQYNFFMADDEEIAKIAKILGKL